MIYIIISLLIYLGYKEYIYSKSLKDLTLKLMARNIGDFSYMVNHEQGLPPSEPVEDPYIDLSESEVWDDPTSFSNAIRGIKEDDGSN